MRIAMMSLSSCLGCQMVFLSLEEYLYTFISENKISYAPFLVNEKEITEVDLALVEGTVRNADHFRQAREIREKSQQVVALGTCAAYGGVQGLMDRFPEGAIIKRRYGQGVSFEGAPKDMRRLLPLDSYIMVDAYLPGCPPATNLLRYFLELALSGSLPTREGATVCAECPVKSPSIPQPGPRRISENIPVPERCLLEQGFICMGPLTRDGCGAECTTQLGVPCTGCRGPSEAGLVSPSMDMQMETVRRLSRSTGKKTFEVENTIKDPAHSFFMHCLSEPILRRRRLGGTSSFTRRLGER
jgi:F420-non-reducing hydrogenase small subunit